MLIRHITNLLSRFDISDIRDVFELSRDGKLPTLSAELKDSEDVCNRIYESNRSRGMSYGFLDTRRIEDINFRVTSTLEKVTGMAWSTFRPLPIFCYREGGRIVEHRDRDVGLGYPEYVAVCMLTQPGKDFTEGRFFVNVGAKVSEDGKTVYDEDVSRRVYLDLNMGDALIFHNPSMIHGCSEVRDCRTTACRMTASWRSSGKRLDKKEEEA